MKKFCLTQISNNPICQATFKRSSKAILSSYLNSLKLNSYRNYSIKDNDKNNDSLKISNKIFSSVVQPEFNKLLSKKPTSNINCQVTDSLSDTCLNQETITTSPVPTLSSANVILTEEEKQLLIKKFEEEYEKRKQDVIEYRSLLTKLKRNENNLRNELYQFKNPNLNFIHSDCEGLPPDLFQQKNLSSLKYISPSTVFANKEVNMNKIDTYGFDYDYTLAQYSRVLAPHLYHMILTNLVKLKHYPKLILNCKFNPKFAVRGIHYDFNACLFFKLSHLFKLIVLLFTREIKF